MPNLIVPVYETHESVTRRAIHGIVTQVMKMTGVDPTTPIRYPGPLGNNYQGGSAISDEPRNTFEHYSKITINVSEEYKDDAIINTPVRYQDAQPIFEDKDLRVLVKPIFSHTHATINFTYRAASRPEVERWRDDIKVRIGDNRQAFMHVLEYHWAVPKFIMVALSHFYQLREKQAGYGDTLQSWFKDKFTKRCTLLTNQNATEVLRVIGERQEGVQGWFDWTEPSQADKDQEGASWTITFAYHVNYWKPVSTNFLYPLVIHNQMIDPIFYSKEPAYTLEARPRLMGDVKASFDHIIDYNARPPEDPLGGIRVPSYDEWTPISCFNHTSSLVNWLIQVDPSDPTNVIDFNNIGDDVFHPAFLKFMRTEYPYINRRGFSFVHCAMFRNVEPMTEPCIDMDENLLVRTRNPMYVREQYHFRLALVTDYSLFTQRAIQAMVEAGRTTLLLFQCLVPELDVEYAAANYLYNGPSGEELQLWYIQWFFNYLKDHRKGETGGGVGGGGGEAGGPGLNGGYYIDWPLVGIVTIIAKREPQGN